jgi:multimeric flavodoxin WrbA
LILGISGSPRSGGSTEYLLNEALSVAQERGFQVERLLCSKVMIGYCTGCGECTRGKTCPQDDDMLSFYGSFQNADGFIVASPVYFGSISGQLKAIFDRTRPLRTQGFLLKDKVGCAIAVGAARNGGQEKAIETIHAWMHIQGLIIVGDNSYSGGIAIDPAIKDNIGRKTVISSANKLCDLLERNKKHGGCFLGD